MDTSKIEHYIKIGKNDINWYAECQKVFEKLFGPEQLPLVAKLFAATSINTSLKSNIKLFRKALVEIKENKPVGDYLPNIKAQLTRIRAGGELTGPKISAFQRAMCGDPNAVVVDTWVLRAFKMDRIYFRQTKGKKPGEGRNRSAGASTNDFRKIEDWIRNYAAMVGLEPRQVCSMIWAGVRIETSGDTNTHYKELLTYHSTNLFGVI